MTPLFTELTPKQAAVHEHCWVAVFLTLCGAGCGDMAKDSHSLTDTSEDSADTSLIETDSSDTAAPDTADSGVEETSPLTFDLSASDARLVGGGDTEWVGTSFGGPVDLNSDGQDDLIVSAGGRDYGYCVLSPAAAHVDLAVADVRLIPNVDGLFRWTSDQSPFTSAGDTDGDGYPDLLLGAMGLGEDYTGGAVLVLGPALGERSLPEEGDALLTGSESNDHAGSAVAGPGDVNGDGFEDLLIGGQGHDVPGLISSVGACATESEDSNYVREDEEEYGLSVGVVWLVLGPVSGERWLGEADATLLGEDAGDGAGHQAGHIGDMDGDGLPDLLASAHANCEGGFQAGAVYVVHSPVTGTMSLADADLKVVGAGRKDALGGTISDGGDVNGDGSPDLLAGAYGPGEIGTAWLVLGPATGHLDVNEADASFSGEADGDSHVGSSSMAGDVDGDGFDDLLFGYSFGEGAAWLFYGPISGAQTLDQAAVQFLGPPDAGAATAVGTAGDTDGDGLADILIGAAWDDEGGEDAGAAFLVLGSTLGAL